MDAEKVLVACPVFDGVKYCLDEFIGRIKSLDYPNYQILLADNSNETDFFDELKKIPGITAIRDSTDEKSNIKRVVSSRNLILNHAKENGFDYLLMMDPDVIPPKEIIKKLLSHKKDVVSGLYFNYFPSKGEIKWLPVAWKQVTEELFEKLKEQRPDVFGSIPLQEKMQYRMTRKEVDSKALIQVVVPSPGCMLLSKKIFSSEFRYEIPDNARPNQGDEIAFLEKIRDSGFKIFCDTGMLCEHRVGDKYRPGKDGKLRHPLFDS